MHSHHFCIKCHISMMNIFTMYIKVILNSSAGDMKSYKLDAVILKHSRLSLFIIGKMCPL